MKVIIMLDITLQKGNIEYLIKYLLPETWQRNCYISEFEGKVQISYKNINDNIHFLKYTDKNNFFAC